jgi:ABC-type branched-subunit amino acid transport system permease subunit
VIRAAQEGGDDVDQMVTALEGWSLDGGKGRLSVRKEDHALRSAALLAVADTAALALVLGAVALRTNGIAFAMVSLGTGSRSTRTC